MQLIAYETRRFTMTTGDNDIPEVLVSAQIRECCIVHLAFIEYGPLPLSPSGTTHKDINLSVDTLRFRGNSTN